ncbi:hypothetical protein M440DRAFT_1171558 [Trichoderma longibrachiatum ATCC 18648]|uniref:Uncharacterized protein n=1 Tax=Trichoderma longibrachiatum ATCC 18648 TaxID=983965 RepID=A0A2T4CD88_TRILO|nr:hypothetical protein M440DRAFT_1171558 [Trichoderma longibrachiatum ATCC 18648]
MQQIWRALKGPSRLDGSCPEALFPLAPSCFFLRFPSGWMEWSGAAYSSRRGHGAKWHHLPSPKLAPQPISGAQTEARPSSTTAVCHATFAVRASGFTGAGAAAVSLLPASPSAGVRSTSTYGRRSPWPVLARLACLRAGGTVWACSGVASTFWSCTIAALFAARTKVLSSAPCQLFHHQFPPLSPSQLRLGTSRTVARTDAPA